MRAAAWRWVRPRLLTLLQKLLEVLFILLGLCAADLFMGCWRWLYEVKWSERAYGLWFWSCAGVFVVLLVAKLSAFLRFRLHLLVVAACCVFYGLDRWGWQPSLPKGLSPGYFFLMFVDLFQWLLGFLGGAVLDLIRPIMHPPTIRMGLFWLVMIVGLLWSCFGSSREALRKVTHFKPQAPGAKKTDLKMPCDPPPGVPHGKRWYLESKSVTADGNGGGHSCSFIEFDERGDYLDFYQHRHARQKIRALAEKLPQFSLVIYVHGWRNNGQSGDVISFNDFLHRLEKITPAKIPGADETKMKKHRIHGVYIAWRGACLKPKVKQGKVYGRMSEAYGGPIVDSRHAARYGFGWLHELLETFSYFSRKAVPEYLFSGTSLSRTLFSCAHIAKRYVPKTAGSGLPERKSKESKGITDDEKKKLHRVFLIGHSLGALMLERTVQNAAIGDLTRVLASGDPDRMKSNRANPLPFDAVLLVNSAAPSIYAKQFQSYLAGHREGMAKAKVKGANAPIFYSLTSSADWATGKIHKWANHLTFFTATLGRDYEGDDFALKDAPDVKIPQVFYYRRTPGHNPLLVNRFIESTQPPVLREDGTTTLEENLQPVSPDIVSRFATTNADGQREEWEVRFPPQKTENNDFSNYKADLLGTDKYRPVAWTETAPLPYELSESAYWIIRCPKEIISGHSDIWSEQAMDTYAALYRIALTLREV